MGLLTVEGRPLSQTKTMQNNVRWPWPFSYINLSSSSEFSFVCVSQPLLGHNLGPLALSSQLPNTTNVHTVASGPKGLQVGIRIGFSLRTNKRRINHSWISSWQFSATCTIHGTLKQSGNETYILLKNWQLLISRDLTKTRLVSF